MTDIGRLLQDHHRPQYHFLPPANWMNDPNGPLFFEGKYHLFYQYNPNGAFHGTIHWGHAVSRNLVHWEHLPIALAPGEKGPDKDGIFSGCAVVKDSTATLIYTGVYPERQCIATTSDMVTFTKYEGNPIISSPPAGLEVTGFRDPFVWQEEDGWYMALGSGFRDVGGAVLLYCSPDLRHWEYLHPLCVGDKTMTARDMWECPNFFPLGDKYVLVVSPYDKVHYWVGTYKDHKFTPEYAGLVDIGESYYAPNSFTDEKGRRIMWGWLREQRSRESQIEAGWSGVMSLPRVLYMKDDNTIGMKPAAEVSTLRDGQEIYTAKEIVWDEVTGIFGDQLEIEIEFEVGSAAVFGLEVAVSPDRSEYTRVGFKTEDQMLFIDTNHSSLSEAAFRGVFGGSLVQPVADTLKLRVFIDHSVIEIFAGDNTCLTGRIYPTRKDSLGISVFSEGGDTKIKGISVWRLRSIW